MDSTIFSLLSITPFGGEDDAANSDSGNGESQGNSDANAKGDASQGNSAGQKSSGKKDSGGDQEDDEFEGYTEAELKRIAKENQRKARQAEQEAAAAKAKIEAEERKKKDELTNALDDLKKANETVATLKATVNRLAIEGAIRDDSRFQWHDVQMVAGLLDPDTVRVTDDGKVEGIKAALPKIAKEHPFLLRGENKNGNKSQQNNGGPTGFQPGQGGASGGGSEVDRSKLVENYPALASRA